MTAETLVQREKPMAQLDDLKQAAMRHVWPNFASRVDLARNDPKFIVSGKGALVWDENGKEYIDAFSAIQTTQIGHGRAEIAEAVLEQMKKLEFYPTVIDYFTLPLVRLAEKMAGIVPGGLERFCFANDGSEAVELALKIAKRYQQVSGHARRYKVISRRWAYHGATMGALSVNGVSAIRAGMEPMVPGVRHVSPAYCYHCELGLSYPACRVACVEEIDRIIAWEGPDTVAAVIVEPVMGAAVGFAAPPREYLPRLRRICDEHGVLLVFDEVSVGFGRTGKWFACQHYDTYPDLMTFAKGVTSGYLPLGGVAVRPEIAGRFIGEHADADFVHGHSFAGHTTSCAAALANIAVMEREGLVDRARKYGAELPNKLRGLTHHPVVGEVRGIGMAFGIEIVKDRETRETLSAELEFTRRVRLRAWELGLICRAEKDIVVLCPPLVMTDEEGERVVKILDQAIGEVAAATL